MFILNELTQRINMILSYSMAKTVNSLRSNSTVLLFNNPYFFINLSSLKFKKIKRLFD
ncbi:hypothetical protein CFB3_27370 [Clostridium folliculivorans]|uniref:Uncharacterized protein n=1 Tax=Clostridium folliculivorans TaxID=2886038 RepID=A0A9W5Y134_9CLOT|nr:hypothetical protein CFOLD11_13580 [Clostridium folliculivorans]GKU30630.1 hypothetical protein CFB3_27370 [Clostridium folliculivorans]